MSARSQHGFHPGAESLSAFAEQALEERERAEVFAHLAVCGRCRQVVALARAAADADMLKAPAPPRKTIAPNAWWRQWRLVWIPAAIVAAFGVASVSTHIWLVDRHEREFKIVAQNPTQGAEPASTTQPTEQAEVVPPVSPAPAPPPAHAAKRAHPAEDKDLTAQSPGLGTTEAPSESGGIDQIEAARETPPLAQAEEQQSPPQSTMGVHGSAYSQPAAAAWEAKQKPAEEQSQAGVDTPRRRLAVAKAAPGTGSAPSANQPASQAPTQTGTAAAVPSTLTATLLPAQPAVSAGLPSQRRGFLAIDRMHLPSGLAIVSSAKSGSIVLAIDKAGTLFLSQDHGNTWERIDTQWTGCAVAVTQPFAVNGALQSAPAAQTGTAPETSTNPGPAPPSPATFELFNDKNQAWVSTDGRIWTSK